jgi:hypothetical protein
MVTVPTSAVVIATAVRNAGLPVEIARTYIAARVPVEIAVKTLNKFSKDVARLRPRRRDAYSLLRDAIGIVAANKYFAPAPGSPRQSARAHPALPAAKAATPRRATSAEMWDEVVRKLNEENARAAPPNGGAI